MWYLYKTEIWFWLWRQRSNRRQYRNVSYVKPRRLESHSMISMHLPLANVMEPFSLRFKVTAPYSLIYNFNSFLYVNLVMLTSMGMTRKWTPFNGLSVTVSWIPYLASKTNTNNACIALILITKKLLVCQYRFNCLSPFTGSGCRCWAGAQQRGNNTKQVQVPFL